MYIQHIIIKKYIEMKWNWNCKMECGIKKGKCVYFVHTCTVEGMHT